MGRPCIAPVGEAKGSTCAGDPGMQLPVERAGRSSGDMLQHWGDDDGRPGAIFRAEAFGAHVPRLIHGTDREVIVQLQDNGVGLTWDDCSVHGGRPLRRKCVVMRGSCQARARSDRRSRGRDARDLTGSRTFSRIGLLYSAVKFVSETILQRESRKTVCLLTSGLWQALSKENIA